MSFQQICDAVRDVCGDEAMVKQWLTALEKSTATQFEGQETLRLIAAVIRDNKMPPSHLRNPEMTVGLLLASCANAAHVADLHALGITPSDTQPFYAYVAPYHVYEEEPDYPPRHRLLESIEMLFVQQLPGRVSKPEFPDVKEAATDIVNAFSKMIKRDPSETKKSPAKVWETKSGDPVSIAIFLVCALRSYGIPARVLINADEPVIEVYVKEQNGQPSWTSINVVEE